MIYKCGCREYDSADFEAWKAKPFAEVEASGNLKHPPNWPKGWEYGQCSECGQKIQAAVTIVVREQTRDTSSVSKFINDRYCECGPKSEFLCYPEDGCCTCGVHKHHVHCANCGGISQIG